MMTFFEWIEDSYLGSSALDNDPSVASRGRFLALRQRIMDYIDEVEELGVSALDARERVASTFRDEIAALEPRERREMESLISFLTGMSYRS